MIRKVRIRRFRRVRDVTLELGRVNVFIGANGAGKTSLLEAIAVLGAAASGKVDAAALRSRGGRPKWHRQVSSIEAWSEGASYRAVLRNPSGRGPWEFIAERMAEGDVEVATRDRRRGLVLLDHGRNEYVAVTPERYEGIAPMFRAVQRSGRLRELLSELERFVLYSPQPEELAGRVPEPGWGPFLGVHGGRLTEVLAEASRDREFWERFYTDVASFRSSRREEITARETGDAARAVLFLFMLLLHPAAPPVLALKNPDAALNPRLALRMMERVVELVLREPERPQLLLATQRPEVLDALDLRDDRVRLFIVGRLRPRHEMFVQRVEYDPAMAELAERGTTLSVLWREGWLGGMPSP